MKTLLHANFLYAQIDEEIDVLMIGFADDEFDTQEYILLQKTLNPNEEDMEAGFDKVHITYNGESQSLYGGIKKFVVTRNRIEIILNEEASEILNSQAVIEINYDQDKTDINEFQNYFIQLFSNEKDVYYFDF
ncbi:hypothetical protein GK047_02445 [Paenibacillus sp. SYP-B3998]|uniref:Immunity protein 10 n=1 Tax=Paenibacillus sp. SYP-B3998 TaxID=2678564 RepID=A0A6G3ZS65_9BACL|nr:Imm10 family immunity protein [Paenibacillus sp. SYP-B3998]NEW04878.1 hypothetical protein [Paenibacillus sp. SYP-B3998]